MQFEHKPQHFLASLLAAMLFTVVGGWSAAAHADVTDLARTPPDLTKSVDPNIVVSFDDSGSMMATAMPDAISNGSYYKDHDYYYSATSNLIYYDPNITYTPPTKPDGTSFKNSTYTNAWRDGMCANWSGSYCNGSANTTDLSDHFYYRFYNITSSSRTSNDLGSNDIPSSRRGGKSQKGGFYYDCPTRYSDTGCTLVKMNSATAEQKQNFANWYSYYRTRNLMARTAMTRAFGKLGDNIRVAWQTINKQPLDSDSLIKALSGTWRDKYFGFLYNVHDTGNTPNRRATIRAGEFFRRGATYDDKDPYWNGLSGAPGSIDEKRDLTCRQNFHMLVTDGYWNWSSNPTLPSGAITSESNGTLPDGHKLDTSDTESSIFWNVSGSTYDSSLANIAYTYWATDLRADLANEVTPYIPDKSTGVTGSKTFNPLTDDPLDNKEIYWNPKNDPATWQHVVQFMITLGIAGDRNFPGDTLALRKGTLAWPKPKNNAPEAVDDTWHAAVNSRGSYFSASNPTELVTHLSEIINSIASRGASATLGSLSSSVISDGAKSYGGGYDSSDWSGTVVQRDIGADGKIDNTSYPNWDAGCLLTGGACKATGSSSVARDPNNRQILTSTDGSDGSGVAFRWSDIGSSNQDALNAGDSNGELRLEYLRGDRAQESKTPLMRRRSSVLGAVINSQVQYLSYPSSGWRDDFPAGSPEQLAAAGGNSYEQFAYDHRDRQATLYVGANDGMLHAFNADTGEEEFAYVPHSVYWSKSPTDPKDPSTGTPLLARLTNTPFNYTPTVDSTPITRDVFFDSDNKWHTMLVGSLGLGGRGVYALDITDPTKVTEGTAKESVLWEFSSDSTGGANLGYTYGTPEIARLATGKWVVLVPGGYFPKCGALGTLDPCATPAAASNDFSSLFVLDAETGALLKELRTDQALTGNTVKSYGLSSPILGDYQKDQIADVAFAGDLMGNVWRFDLTAKTSSGWKTDLVVEGATDSSGKPLQPITSSPRLFADRSTGRFMVVFGTGRYLGLSDRNLNSLGTQAMYGVREQGASDRGGNFPTGYYPLSAASLQAQDLTEDAASGVRFLTDKPLPGVDTSGVLLKGWKINLDVPDGERVVVRPQALASVGLAVFSTLIPGGNDPCNPGRDGAILVVDAATGGSPGDSIDSLAYNSGVSIPSDTHVTGKRIKGVPQGGRNIPTLTPIGGGKMYIPGLPDMPPLNIQPIYHRGSWRVLNDVH